MSCLNRCDPQIGCGSIPCRLCQAGASSKQSGCVPYGFWHCIGVGMPADRPKAWTLGRQGAVSWIRRAIRPEPLPHEAYAEHRLVACSIVRGQPCVNDRPRPLLLPGCTFLELQ